MKRLILALVLVATGCAGSFVKDADNQLKLLAGAYSTAAPARADYCRPWEKPTVEVPTPPTPKPGICAEAMASLTVAYETLKEGTGLLATYAAVKTEDTKAKIIALLPKVAEAIIAAQNVAMGVK